MLNTPTHDQLCAMRLTGMAQAWLDQQRNPEFASLSFDERFGLLVEAEALYRDNRRLKRWLRQAKLRIGSACVEDVQCSDARGLPCSLVRQLMTGRWLDEAQNVVIVGKTGTGKTYLACALAQHACRTGRPALYKRLSLLLDEMMQARAAGTYTRMLRELGRARLLVIDDWAITPLTDVGRRDLLEVFDDRYGRASTVVTSQLDVKHWHEYIGEPTIADAILDRLVHNAYKIELRGPSLRERKE